MTLRRSSVVPWVVLLVALLSMVGQAAPAKGKISFLHYLSTDTMEILQPLIDRFEAIHDIEVEVTYESSAEVVN